MSIEYGPFTQAQGAQTLNIGSETNLVWHHITVSIINTSTGQTATPTAGTIAASARMVGADVNQAFTEDLNLPMGHRSWNPFAAALRSVVIAPTGLDADKSYIVTITNWSQ